MSVFEEQSNLNAMDPRTKLLYAARLMIELATPMDEPLPEPGKPFLSRDYFVYRGRRTGWERGHQGGFVSQRIDDRPRLRDDAGPRYAELRAQQKDDPSSVDHIYGVTWHRDSPERDRGLAVSGTTLEVTVNEGSGRTRLELWRSVGGSLMFGQTWEASGLDEPHESLSIQTGFPGTLSTGREEALREAGVEVISSDTYGLEVVEIQLTPHQRQLRPRVPLDQYVSAPNWLRLMTGLLPTDVLAAQK